MWCIYHQCPICTLINDELVLCCMVCGSEKPSHDSEGDLPLAAREKPMLSTFDADRALGKKPLWWRIVENTIIVSNHT